MSKPARLPPWCTPSAERSRRWRRAVLLRVRESAGCQCQREDESNDAACECHVLSPVKSVRVGRQSDGSRRRWFGGGSRRGASPPRIRDQHRSAGQWACGFLGWNAILNPNIRAETGGCRIGSRETPVRFDILARPGHRSSQRRRLPDGKERADGRQSDAGSTRSWSDPGRRDRHRGQWRAARRSGVS